MKKIIFGVASLVVLATMGYFAFYYNSSATIPANVSETKIANSAADTKITGVITDVKNDCWADGACSIQVNNKWRIVLGEGMVEPGSEPAIKGDVKDIQFDERKSSLGKKVEIFGRVAGADSISIYGDKNYYVHVIE